MKRAAATWVSALRSPGTPAATRSSRPPAASVDAWRAASNEASAGSTAQRTARGRRARLGLRDGAEVANGADMARRYGPPRRPPSGCSTAPPPQSRAAGGSRRAGLRRSARMTEPEQITIVLADDHVVVRSGLRLLLDQAGGFRVVAEAGNADAALRSVLGHKPDVLVLDLNMPGEPTSLEAIPQVAERPPGTRVVVLTMQEDPSFARHALQAGAAGYVLKEGADTQLVEAGPRAAAGGADPNPPPRAPPGPPPA